MTTQPDRRVDEREPDRIPASDRALLLRLARETLEAYLKDEEEPAIPHGSRALREPRATFVTLRRRSTGELRGCRGETQARRPLAESVAEQTIASATDDPRFEPVGVEELPDLDIHISALTHPEPIEPGEVVLGRHGLLLRHGGNAGLLLPEVPAAYGLETRQAFLDALCRKAGLPAGAWEDGEARLFGFETESWGET